MSRSQETGENSDHTAKIGKSFSLRNNAAPINDSIEPATPKATPPRRFHVYSGGLSITHREIRDSEIKGRERRAELFDEHPNHWGVYDSGLSQGKRPFDSDFIGVIPDNQYFAPLRSYIEHELASLRGNAIGLELGGPGVRLFSGFSETFFQQTAGVCLSDGDNRPPIIPPGMNHLIIRGDMTAESTKQEVQTNFGRKKFNVIFERLAGAVLMLPKEPFFMANEVSYWYDQLAVGGLFFAELPPAFDHTIDLWEQFVSLKHAKDIEVQTDINEHPAHSFIRLSKLFDAPLPLLDARTVLQDQRKRGKYRGTDRY